MYRGMRVKVKTFATLRDITGGIIHDIEVRDGSKLRDVLEEVFNLYPDLRDEVLDDEGSLKSGYRLLVNGREATHIGGFDLEVKDGDVIALFPPVAGG